MLYDGAAAAQPSGTTRYNKRLLAWQNHNTGGACSLRYPTLSSLLYHRITWTSFFGVVVCHTMLPDMQVSEARAFAPAVCQTTNTREGV